MKTHAAVLERRRCPRTPVAALVAAVVACLLPLAALAAEYRGLTLPEAFARLQEAGLSILYSSDVVKPWMRVEEEPAATEPRAVLAEILRPHGIVVSEGPGGALVLVRRSRARAAPPLRPVEAPEEAQDIARVVVTASLYELLREPIRPVRSLSAADLRASPDLGDDPMRSLSRLPGTANGDFTARANIRGGEAGETLVRFHGLRLYDPFHFKDFQGVFSAIDPGVVSGIDVYTGGYPASFGDRMSGVIDIVPVSAKEQTHRELSLSFFNASVLGSGLYNEERGDWVLSVRRGNPDLLIRARDADIGRPSYFDAYGRLGHALTDRIRLSANALLFEDDITLHDGDREESARAGYRDVYAWLRLDYEREYLQGSVLLAQSNLDSHRSGTADQPGVSRGTLADRRSFDVSSVQSDWSWRMNDRTLLQFGAELRRSSGNYEYDDEAQFDLVFDLPEVASPPLRTRSLRAAPEGNQYAAYTNARYRILDDVVVDAGLRWDRESLSVEGGNQLSPRLGILYRHGDALSLRASWGHYFQAQAVNELQVPDGVTEVYPAQRSRHLVLSGEYHHAAGIGLRLEAYRKDYRELRPRFENLLNTFVLLPELKPDRIRIAPDSATATGLELTLRQERGALAWWASYGWSRVMDRTSGRETPRSWDQQNAAGAGVAWLTPSWEFSLAGKYHSGWPTTELELGDAGPVPVVEAGVRNARRQKNYATLDARVARLFEFDGGASLTLFAELTNAFSRTNPCCVEYSVEPDEDTGELVLEVEQVQALPLVPSLGFVWRF